jgi:hypothetical protein
VRLQIHLLQDAAAHGGEDGLNDAVSDGLAVFD